MKELIIILFTLTLISSKCSKKPGQAVNPGFYTEGFELNYLVNQPSNILKLDRDLTEISGIAFSTENNMLLGINDEEGVMYHISPKNGVIIDKTKFAKSDDYEGIAYIDGKIFIAESNGNIKVVSEKLQDKVKEYDDILSSDHDVEGVAYDPTSNSILLAAKGDSRSDDNVKSEKSIFTMDMSSGNIAETPYLSLNLIESVKDLNAMHISQNVLVNLSVTSRLKEFSPSGIAVHPVTSDIYILSARGKLLVVVDKFKNIKAIIFLDQSLHPQAEGICFGVNQTLYIANEGRANSGMIYSYKKLQ